MAVGLKAPESVLPVNGVMIGIAEAGIRYQSRPDLVLMSLAEDSTVAAVFTQNRCCAAPVSVAREHLAIGAPRALLINAGNANAATGDLGLSNAVASCAMVADKLGVDTNQVLPFSTGVIGEQLNMTAMQHGVSTAAANLQENGWLAAASAIMTTDTVAKAVSRQVDLGGTTVTLTGIAKGSGMICPNMATMLAYVATDAAIPAPLTTSLLVDGVEASFNRITVDSDTSTNDALALVATGQSEVSIDSDQSDYYAVFYEALEALLIELATAVVRDAEGATKFVNILVDGAASDTDAKAVAYSIAHSPLVKTALFASDPNWGRIMMALGKAPVEQLDMGRVNIRIGEVNLIQGGEPAMDYTEERGKAVFLQDEITIHVDLNLGQCCTNVWTSDLSHDYVSINADYRS